MVSIWMKMTMPLMKEKAKARGATDQALRREEAMEGQRRANTIHPQEDSRHLAQRAKAKSKKASEGRRKSARCAKCT